MKPSIAFRVDSGRNVGIGHVMRCLTLAQALRDRNLESVFLSRPSHGSIEHEIERNGFSVIRLPPATKRFLNPSQLMHGDFLDCGQDEDAEVSLGALQTLGQIQSVVVDHYGIYAPWDHHLYAQYKIFKIDDIADRHHHCHGLLDQNFFCQMDGRYKELIPNSAIRLLGPSYALLRKQFANLDVTQRLSRNSVTHILVSFGGRDPQGYSLLIAQQILESTTFQVSVLGVQDQSLKSKWSALTGRFPERLQILEYVADPKPLMQNVDLYVGAGGTTTWERFATGLPGVVYSIARNQIEMSRDLDAAGFQIYAGNIQDFDAQKLCGHLIKLQKKELRNSQIVKMHAEVDGLGPARVVKAWGLSS